MRRITGILAMVALLAGCKKDLLQPHNVQQADSHTTDRINHVRFLTDKLVIAAGGDLYQRSTILTSNDGGYTWTTYSAPDAPKEMRGMYIAPGGTIYLCGVDGDVLVSADSGASWQFHRIDNWLFYQGGGFPAGDTGIFVSTTVQRQSNVVRVNKGFGIIDQLTYSFGLNNIYFTGPGSGYIIGYGAVMKTTDNGRNWAFQDVKGDNFTAMDIHGAEIWMCGSNGGIYHTADGGGHWTQLRNGNNLAIPRYWLRSIVFSDDRHGWAVGDEGKLLYTNDAGHHWAEYSTFTKSNLRDVVICPGGDLLVVGDNGAIFRIRP